MAVTSEEIQVAKNGVTIGWRLMVALGAILLGYYVTTVIAPIRQEQRLTMQRVSQLETLAEEYKKFVTVVTTHLATDDSAGIARDARLNSIDADIKAFREKLHTFEVDYVGHHPDRLRNITSP